MFMHMLVLGLITGHLGTQSESAKNGTPKGKSRYGGYVVKQYIRLFPADMRKTVGKAMLKKMKATVNQAMESKTFKASEAAKAMAADAGLDQTGVRVIRNIFLKKSSNARDVANVKKQLAKYSKKGDMLLSLVKSSQPVMLPCCDNFFALSCNLVNVNPSALGKQELTLPGGITVTFLNMVANDPNAYHYVSKDADIILTYNPESKGLHGHAKIKGRSFVIENCGSQGHVWKQLDSSKFLDD